MSAIGIASTLFTLLQASGASATARTGEISAEAQRPDFSAALKLRLAELQAQSQSSLFSSFLGSDLSANSGSALDFLNTLNGTATTSAHETGLSASGYNLSLFDPESAFTMMSVINTRDVTYKAQFSELSAMKTAVSGMQDAAQTLGSVDSTQPDTAVRTQLQTFATAYNAWITRFDDTVKDGGLLDGTQAAEISLYELEQSVENIFNGAADGFHGLADLGFTIDPVTNLASLDVSVLDSALASNKTGVINTIDQFSANFAKSAELLNASDNFIPNRLANLDRVIDFLDENMSSLQAEFGLGSPAKRSAEVARALAAYHSNYAV